MVYLWDFNFQKIDLGVSKYKCNKKAKGLKEVSNISGKIGKILTSIYQLLL